MFLFHFVNLEILHAIDLPLSNLWYLEILFPLNFLKDLDLIHSFLLFLDHYFINSSPIADVSTRRTNRKNQVYFFCFRRNLLKISYGEVLEGKIINASASGIQSNV